MVKAVRCLLGILISICFLSACGGGGKNTTTAAVPESAYCSTTFPTANPITVAATAQYYYRPISTTAGLSGNPVARGIAHAEVVVTNSSGTVIQCSKTDAAGGISFQINKTAGAYTIIVNSRAFNSALKASVLTDPSSNAVYAISKAFSLTGSEVTPLAAGTFYAFARIAESANMEGAAFHILYNLHLSNDYIRTQIGDASFVAEKVSAFWKQGFNPGAYVGVASGLSFYLQGQRELYILGGMSGNTKTQDTDHFDDSVIIHEYGHFLEDVYSRSTSPGGSHNGNFIIDPRLAWSEGWANFLQGAVITPSVPSRGSFYIDTIGYSGDTSETGETGSMAIKFDLSVSGAATGPDKVSVAGEGTFRELSVSRLLYKVITTTSIPFSAMWTAFTDTVNGVKAPGNIFTNVGMFNKYLNLGVPGGQTTSWNNLLANEQQNKTTLDYADPVLPSVTCAKYPRALSPVADEVYSGAEPRSNKLRSNDFYQFFYNGSGGTLSLNYTQVSGDIIDLDLYLYNSSYNYQEDYYESIGAATGSVVLKSDRALAFDGGSTSGTESFSLATVPSGYYLINVKANTFNKISADLVGTAQYSLSFQGNFLCPEN